MLDLDAVLAAGWADPEHFSREEFARAEQFWLASRAEDTRLGAVRAEAARLIRSWTGRQPRDVGSFGIQTNLESSDLDLDLGIGYPAEARDALITVMTPHASFAGERRTRFDTTRLVFSFTLHGVEIDVSALTEADFTVACRMLDHIDTA
ncbi:hypothetical protein GCM10012275_30380 [Longimycelium tulufanense]|uniref:Uncharacterized protein n=1 Tax=Longimycelium tulufanense TaxID=907463 RepID=A0A8J3FVD3_9PSEU|nr:hypothetical protein [Longimycelium tulufanense]GGM57195.1 hypothetical protein GCM10012275_30380 [Longimycelium tulufanense]